MKNVLITGANGQLGMELGKIMPAAVLAGHNDLDIVNKQNVNDFVRKNHIEVIVNCAAYTAVDAAETDCANAYKTNVIGAKNLAQTGCKLIQISTDYVFDGKLSFGGYSPSDMPHALSVYGTTKQQSEIAALDKSENNIVIRTSWLFSPYGKNFVKTMQKFGATRPEISVVNDQYGLPTYAADLAAAIVQIIPQMTHENMGIYHYSNVDMPGGTPVQGISWYDFAVEIMRQSNLNCAVKPITTAEYPTAAMRPKYSVLDTTKIQDTFGIKIPTWRDGLKRCIGEMQR